jgi:CheY-like chemotaxis protein
MGSPRKKILCVEDDLETASLIAEEFEERGYEMALAHDGQAGFAAVLKLQPDLVLCDVSMPVMSRFELLERLTALTPRLASPACVNRLARPNRSSRWNANP